MNVKVLAILNDENTNTILSTLTELKSYNIQLIIASNILDGIDLFIMHKPIILILDDNLKGFMLAKTVNDIKNIKTVIFMLSEINNITFNKDFIDCYIDFYIPKPLNKVFFQLTLVSYIKKHLLTKEVDIEIKRAEEKQLQNLPTTINNEHISINYIYSPYNKLSGDKLQLLSVGNKYYGIVIDCTGHDLLAWQQTGMVEFMFKYSLKFLKQGIFNNISEVLEDVNRNLVSEEIYVAAVVFEIDLNSKVIKYVSAGIPSFFIKYKNTASYEKKLMKGKVLGYKIDSQYLEHTLDICNIDKLIFTTDGITETLNNQTQTIMKNDDISAFFITFK